MLKPSITTNRGPAQARDINFSDPTQVRRAIRSRAYTGYTNGVADGFVQGNLVIVPAEFAPSLEVYCERNPQPCPLLGMSEPGVPHIPSLAADMDLRTDVGEYRIFRDGESIGTETDIRVLWRDDLVSFVLGCSFSFEHEMMKAGVRLRHIEEKNVSAMYVTDIDTVPSPPFTGKLVVSMRPIRRADATRAVEISSRFPKFHGPPVHIGEPAAIGVDLARPYGGTGLTSLRDDEVPVFWACGQTTQLALENARLPFAITHSKAHMVLTDLSSESLRER
jgi:uncharacterized protein YcsI (UPF0317 family)